MSFQSWAVGFDLCAPLFSASAQAQLQRSLDSSLSGQPRVLIGRRGKKEAVAAATESDGSPLSEQDSGILDVEDEEDDDDEVRTQTVKLFIQQNTSDMILLRSFLTVINIFLTRAQLVMTQHLPILL